LIAACEGNYKTAKLLIENGADVNAEVRNTTPLGIARSNKQNDIVQLLLENGAIDRKKIEKNKQKEIDEIDRAFMSGRTHYSQAEIFAAEGNYEQAIKHLKNSIKIYEKIIQTGSDISDVKGHLAVSYCNLATLYMHLATHDKKLYSQSEENFKNALELNPKYVEAYYGLSRVHYFGTKQAKKALHFCEKAIELQPQNEEFRAFKKWCDDAVDKGTFDLYIHSGYLNVNS